MDKKETLTAIQYWIEDLEDEDSPWESEIREINLLKWAVKTITAQQKEIARLHDEVKKL